MASGSKRVVLAALAANLGIAACKGFAAVATGSAAMLSEAAHSLVDSGNQALLLFGMSRATRPADAHHPFGYHREIYFWSFVVAVALFLGGGAFAINEGLGKISHPEAAPALALLGRELPGWGLNLAILLAAACMEGYAFAVAWRELRARGVQSCGALEAVRRSTDPALFVVLFEDAAALLGLLLAIAGVALSAATGAAWIDGAASVAIGGVLVLASGMLAWETRSLLIGEGADARTVAAIRDMARTMPGVLAVNEVITEWRGPHSLLVLLSIDWADGLDAGTVERGTTTLERRIKAAHPEVGRVFVESQSRQDSAAAAAAELALAEAA